MSKNKGSQNKTLRRLAREAELRDNHVGVRNRAQTFVDRRKAASRKACRGKVAW